jgi:PKD repeat protein
MVGAAAGTVADPAAATDICSPTDSAFCVTYTAAVDQPGTSTAETRAAAPVDVSVSAANTSTDQSSSTTHWLDHIVLTLFNGLGGKAYTPSAKLDNNLLVAGSSTDCSAADFSDCTAGHGTFYADITGSGYFDGIYPGNFGIQRITNVNPTTVAGADLQWNVALTFCIHGTPITIPCQNENFTAAAASAGSGTVTVPARPAQPITYGSASIDASMSTAEIHLNGVSTTLNDGTPAPSGQQTVMHLPLQCGTASAAATLVDRAGASVVVPLSQSVTGCPTARFTSTQRLRTAHFNGSTSTTPLSPDRTIAKWRWSFGDGKSQVTTSATVAHTYSSSRDRTVRLVVQDSLGALSKVRTLLLKGTALSFAASHSTVASGTAVRLSGRLTRWHTTIGLAGRSLRIDRCRAGTCRKLTTLTTSKRAGHRGEFQLTIHPTRTYTYRATFFGGQGFLGVRKSVKVSVT